MTEAVAMLCRHLHSPISEVLEMSLDEFDNFFDAMISVLKREAPK